MKSTLNKKELKLEGISAYGLSCSGCKRMNMTFTLPPDGLYKCSCGKKINLNNKLAIIKTLDNNEVLIPAEILVWAVAGCMIPMLAVAHLNRLKFKKFKSESIKSARKKAKAILKDWKGLHKDKRSRKKAK